jgi:hypothetical protein
VWVLAPMLANANIDVEQPTVSSLLREMLDRLTAQTFELKSLILAQIERWRHA